MVDDVGEIPLPPEPDAEEFYDRYGDDDFAEQVAEEVERAPSSAEETAAREQRWRAARRVHIAAPRMFVRWSEGGFDPRGRHVGCDGEPDGAGSMRGGCGRPPGQPCEHPRRGPIVGFVHPTRLAAEMALFGIDPTTVAV